MRKCFEDDCDRSGVNKMFLCISIGVDVFEEIKRLKVTSDWATCGRSLWNVKALNAEQLTEDDESSVEDVDVMGTHGNEEILKKVEESGSFI